MTLLALWLVGSVASAPRARAEALDLTLSRLSRGDCAATLGEDEPLALERDGAQALVPDQASFRALVAQLGSALAPVVIAPAVTSGPRGFDVALESTLTDLDRRSDALARGTRGRGAGTEETCDGRNTGVPARALLNRLHVHKALPLGVSLGASVGKLHAARMYVVGADLTLALLEDAFHSRVPDLALRTALARVVSASALTMMTVSFDAIVSERLIVAHTFELSPYLGAGALWTRASSGLVDLTPNIDALACRAGTDPVCTRAGVGASDDDLGHDVRFTTVSLLRYRAFVGFRVRYGHVALASAFTSDLRAPAPGDGEPLPRQWSLSVSPAVTF